MQKAFQLWLHTLRGVRLGAHQNSLFSLLRKSQHFTDMRPELNTWWRTKVPKFLVSSSVFADKDRRSSRHWGTMHYTSAETPAHGVSTPRGSTFSSKSNARGNATSPKPGQRNGSRCLWACTARVLDLLLRRDTDACSTSNIPFCFYIHAFSLPSVGNQHWLSFRWLVRHFGVMVACNLCLWQQGLEWFHGCDRYQEGCFGRQVCFDSMSITRKKRKKRRKVTGIF